MPNPYVQLANAVLRLAETVFATRESAYNRKLDKRQEVAINYAEQAFGKVSVLYEFIHENMVVPKDKIAEFDRIKKLIYRLRDKFNKYD